MEFKNIELVANEGIELKCLDKARCFLDKLPLVVDSHKENRNAAGFAFMELGIRHFMGENNRHLVVLSPCGNYSVMYEGFNNLSSNDYRIQMDVFGKGEDPKANGPRVYSVRIIPKYESEMDLELSHHWP